MITAHTFSKGEFMTAIRQAPFDNRTGKKVTTGTHLGLLHVHINICSLCCVAALFFPAYVSKVPVIYCSFVGLNLSFSERLDVQIVLLLGPSFRVRYLCTSSLQGRVNAHRTN